MTATTGLEFRLLNEFQRDFPLQVQPFAEIARVLATDERTVITTLARLRESGVVSRIGAVFAPRRIGASTLAALAAPEGQLERIADLVSAHAEVNHNYQREHYYNLWFVVAAQDQQMLDATLRQIESETGCSVLRLPLVDEFHIDLGFDLGRHQPRSSAVAAINTAHPYHSQPLSTPLSERQQALLRVLQDGLELLPRPFSRLAMRSGLDEAEVLAIIRDWLATGYVKRFGVVVRHRELGYTANAMCVWDIPDALVTSLGRRLAAESAVTLCYRRARVAAEMNWPYNLFCMIHGRNRSEVEAQIADLNVRHGLSGYPHNVLFSVKRFKQCGARYMPELAHA